jgi:hypothetical protein
MSFICPNQKYDSKGQKTNKHPNGKYKDYGFYHMERAIIAPRITPNKQAPKKSFMSISYFTRY